MVRLEIVAESALSLGQSLFELATCYPELDQLTAQLRRSQRIRHQEVQASSYQPFGDLELALGGADCGENRDYRGVLFVARDEPLGFAGPALRHPQVSEQCERLGMQLGLDELAHRKGSP